MARKKIKDMIAELQSWLPNYDHGEGTFSDLLFRVLASLPGGERAEDVGYQPINGMGWHEADQLGRMLETIQDKGDVEDIVSALLDDDENLDEPRGVREARRIDVQTVIQAIHDGASYEEIEEMLNDDRAHLTDEQIEMLRRKLSDRYRVEEPRRARESSGRTIYISPNQNLAALIDNAYGYLTNAQGTALLRAIDDAERDGEDPKRAAIEYLSRIGITVRVHDDVREPRRVARRR